jgi:hypothetical protein
LAVVAVIGAGHRAAADKQETSVDVHFDAGVVRLGEDGTDEIAIVPVVGIAGRGTYGMSDALQLELEVGAAQSMPARFDEVTVSLGGGMMTGPLERVTRSARLELGASLRLGVEFIPIVYAGIGGQLRSRADATFVSLAVVPESHGAELAVDLVGTVQVGFDYRINRRWIAGVRAGAVQAVPLGAPAFTAVEGSAMVAYYWYRRWWWWEE